MNRLLWAIGLACAAGFVVLAVAVARQPYLEIDLWLTRALQAQRTDALEQLANAVAWPGFPPQSNVIFGALIAVMAALRQFTAAVWQLVAAAGSAALWFATTPLIERPRPSPDLVYVAHELPFGSFPSGHTLNLTAGFGFTWFAILMLMPHSAARTVLLWVVPVFLVLLGVARVFVGQHWPSDVFGGYLLGVVWLTITVLGYLWTTRSAARLRQRRELAA